MNYRRFYEDAFWHIEITDETTNQLIANCPFCGKEKHFFISQETGQWDCKICDTEGGNVYTFMQKYYDYLKSNYDNESEGLLRTLSALRSVSYLKLKEFGIIPLDKHNYIIPYFNEHRKIVNLKTYNPGKKPIGLPEIKLGVYGLEELFDQKKKSLPIFRCEGEFDRIALSWFLEKIDYKAIVIASPGASLKKSDRDYFHQKVFFDCPDKDDAGRKGSEHNYKYLGPIIKEFHRIEWPNDCPKGYDVNDFIKDNVLLTKNLRDSKGKFFSYFTQVGKNIALSDIETRLVKSVNYKELLEELSTTLELSDNFSTAFKLAVATCISTQIQSDDPVWLFLVGPPGCGKSTICTSFKLAENRCLFQSNLSSKALVSGWAGGRGTGADPSLVPLLNKKTLILKDLTEVLTRNSAEKNEIFGILRGAYDGYVQRTFANGTTRAYYSKFSIVAGVTRKIYAEDMSDLGERFLRYNMSSTLIERNKQLDTVMESSLAEKEARLELQKLMYAFLEREYDVSYEYLRSLIPDWFKIKLKALTTLVATLRTKVDRYQWGRMQHEVIYSPEAENPNRLTVQFQKLSLSLCLVEEKQEIDHDIYNILKKIGRDSINNFVYDISNYLYLNSSNPVSIENIRKALRITDASAMYILQDLELLGIVKKDNAERTKYSLTSEFKTLFGQSEFYSYGH